MSRLTTQLQNYNEGRVGTTVHVDLIFCILTIVATMATAYYINLHIVSGEQPLLTEFFAGVTHAILYLQVLTLIVLAVSYVSPLVSSYRGLIMNLLPIGIYLAIRIVTDPEPVEVMYSYGALIATLGITFYKVKALGHFLFATVWVPNHCPPSVHRRVNR